jgi:hypothetical protein
MKLSWCDVEPYMKNADLLLTFLWDNKLNKTKIKFRRIAKNTLYITDDSGNEYIHYYATTVCIYNRSSGEITLNTGGHITNNTVDRMNLLSPITVKYIRSSKSIYVKINKNKYPIVSKLNINFKYELRK